MLIRQNNYIEQLKSSKREKKKETSSFHLPFAPPFIPGDLRRVVFVSITELERYWKTIPPLVLESCILCLDCDRSWVFHKFSEGKGSEKQIRFFKKQFDSRYMDFEDDFLAFLKKKEGQELAYWHRPKKSYADMSKFFESIRDTVQKDEDLNPLILDEEAWTEFGQSKMWASGYVWFPPPKKTETGKDEASSVDTSTKMLAGLSGSKLSRKGGGKKTKKKKKALPHNVRRPRFTASVGKVLSCIKSGSADENTMKELIFQSNPTLSFYIPDH